jgi:serine/threonine protein kinase
MGEVYRAKDTRLGRIVAIKVLPSHLSSNPELRQRLEREARAVSSLNHPHICTLYDIGPNYLVMEFIEGKALSTRLQKGPLATADLLQYSIQIAGAPEKAHKQGIIHRDLKPGNIMLTKTGIKLRFRPCQIANGSFKDAGSLHISDRAARSHERRNDSGYGPVHGAGTVGR